MDYKKIIDFIREDGAPVTDEAKEAAQNLAEIIEAQNANLADVSGVLAWLEQKRKAYEVAVSEIGINQLIKWNVDSKTGNISHESGKFFSIVGVKVEGAKGREVLSWTQPMIKQEECGILGILCKKIKGVMHYLLFAKYEPGTIASLQLSPTLQATASNLSQAHGGKKPLFAEFFETQGKGKIISSSVEVEDPGRFFHKTNRCMIVEVSEQDVADIPDDYIWLTLPQIKKLVKLDNVINALARCVLGSR